MCFGNTSNKIWWTNRLSFGDWAFRERNFNGMAKRKHGKKRKAPPDSVSVPPPSHVGLKPEDFIAAKEIEAAPDPEPPTAGPTPALKGRFFNRFDWIAGLAAALVLFAVYLYTLAPDVTLEDSGELAVGSMYAGVPHPPGYPVWTLYSWAFTKLLPFSNIAWRVTVSSAFAAALACGIIAMMVSRGSLLMLEGIEKFREFNERQRRWLCLAVGLSAGLILGFNGFVWSQAVIVEVYTLSILTFVLTLVFLMRWFFIPEQRRYLYLALFMFGLCFTNHQTLLLASPGLVIVVLLGDRKLGKDILMLCCFFYIIGLIMTLRGAGDPTGGNSDGFILFNLIGAGLMATLLGVTMRMPVKSLSVLVGAGYFALAIIFGFAWDMMMDKQHLDTAIRWVKVWAILNTLLLGALIIYSWINRPDKEPGLLSHLVPTLNTAGCFLVGAAFYLYLPIASMTNPPMNWAYPRTIEGFEHAVTRGQYDKMKASDFTRMFIDHRYQKDQKERTSFNGGQVSIYLDEAQEEFSFAYMALALIPLAFIHRMRHRDVRWIAGLIGVYISFTLMLIYARNPLDSEQSRHLEKVFFAATHVFIALGLGYGLALLGAALATRSRNYLPGLAIFLVLLAGVELYKVFAVFGETHFAFTRAAAVVGLVLILALIALAGWLLLTPRNPFSKFALIATLVVLPLLPLRPALNNWADNEQRGHLYGFWYGHDMFTPPFDVYPEMDRGAILLGGTDPGRFLPTYFIFCESFIDPADKRDPDFDRRDVYIITQNALADHHYLPYIRAHYNRSAQVDPMFFTELANKINQSEKRDLLNILLILGILAGLGIVICVGILMSSGSMRDPKLIGTGAWGGILIIICFAGTSGPLSFFTGQADSLFTRLGTSVEASRRAAGVYPEKEINTPSSADNQTAFATYLKDAQERMLTGKIKPGENVTLIYDFHCHIHQKITLGFNQRNIRALIQAKTNGAMPCPICLNARPRQNTPMPIPDPRVSVQGNTSVMAINALLAKNIFYTNREHAIYLEESFPLEWMYPYLRPYGIILKLEAEREFEIASITPPNFKLDGLKAGDVLTPINADSDTGLEPLIPGKFTIGAIGTNGVIQRIHVSNPGQYEIKPAVASFAIGEGTNVTSARIKLTMEPIVGTPSHRIAQATINPLFPGTGYKPRQKLFLQSAGGYQPIQYQGTDAGTFLEVKTVDETGAIQKLTITDNGGRFIIMPPTEINFINQNGLNFRAVVDFRRIPTHKKRLPEEVFTKDREFWSLYSSRLIGNWITEETTVQEICEWSRRIYLRGDLTGFKGDPTFVRDNDAQKGFSKLRSAIADLYAWRHRTTTDQALKARYAREADFAFRQALAFGPINPEVAYKYVNLLNTLGRFEDAKRVAQTLDAMDSNSNSGQKLLANTYRFQEETLKFQFDFTNAAHMALEISKLEKLDPNRKSQALARYTKHNQLAIHYQHPITSFHDKPGSLLRFNRVIRTYSELKKPNDLAQAIELFSKSSIPNRSNLTAIQNAHGLTGNWEAKLKTDQLIIDLDPESYIPWFDLALSHLRLQQTNESVKAMAKSMELFGPAKSKPIDVMSLVRTNALFAPLREQPEIKKILERD